MDFILSDAQNALKDLAQDFADNELKPYAAHWDETKTFPVETFKKAASLGFAGIYVKEDVGGSGLGRIEAALLFESLSSACVSSAAYLSIHNMVAGLIDQFGTEEQRNRFLPKLMNMEHFSSYCLTEPNAGSDAASLQTKAILKGDHYIVNGSKAFISGAGISDLYLVMVRSNGPGAKGISCLLVDKNTPGLTFGKPEKKMGWNSQPTAIVQFNECKIPIENRLGQESEGFKIAMKALDGGRINIAACSLGGANACLAAAKDYIQSRSQFGHKLSDFQALQFKLADMATELSAAQLMVYRAASSLDNHHPDTTLHCAMAKRFATDIGFDVVNQALQLHGGYGYLKDYPIERFFRDLRVHQILEGTNEIMRVIIAKKLLEN
ncbi:MAG: acyl-CoA dehydrogenase family protein [Alphaproteobacteria bacterium]|nr:acyl-CoA dehydrogenase family protein [Alphaproteobacteria bacterium]